MSAKINYCLIPHGTLLPPSPARPFRPPLLSFAWLSVAGPEELSVNRAVSRVHFSLLPLDRTAPRFTCSGALSKLILGRKLRSRKSGTKDMLQEALLPYSSPEASSVSFSDEAPQSKKAEKSKFMGGEEKTINMLGANVIVVCDVLNALGAGAWTTPALRARAATWAHAASHEKRSLQQASLSMPSRSSRDLCVLGSLSRRPFSALQGWVGPSSRVAA